MLDELRDGNVHANLGLACVSSLLESRWSTSVVQRTTSLNEGAPVAPIMISCMTRRLLVYDEPPLMTFIQGTGRMIFLLSPVDSPLP